MTTTIETRGLDEIIQRMQAYPEKLNRVMKTTMEATLLILWENVPSYPTQKGSNPTYERTGTLGRTLGMSMDGSTIGQMPSIYENKQLGSGDFQGRFGTNLEYAPYVIGDTTQAVHMGYWWQMKDIAARAKDKIQRVWKNVGDQMAAFLERG